MFALACPFALCMLCCPVLVLCLAALSCLVVLLTSSAPPIAGIFQGCKTPTPTERSSNMAANLTEIASVGGLTDLWHENIHHLLGSANLPDAISNLKDSSYTCCSVRLALAAAVNTKADMDGGMSTSMDLEHKDLGMSASSVDRLCPVVVVCCGVLWCDVL